MQFKISSISILVFCWCLFQTSMAQEVDSINNNSNTKLKHSGEVLKQSDEAIKPDVKAVYEYGESAFLKFVAQNVQYPKRCMDVDVTIGFAIEVDGSLSEFKVINEGASWPEMEDEIIRVLELTSGKWIPAKLKHGGNVKSYKAFPLKLRRE